MRLHNDHTKYLPNALKYQLPVYSCRTVAEKFKGVKVLELGKKYRIGDFLVQPIQVPHGDCECYAYIIEHDDFGKLLWATDLSDFPYKVKGVNHILLECNNSLDAIVGRMMDGRKSMSSVTTHLDEDKCFEVLHRLKSPDLQTIVLLHLSDANSNEDTIRNRLKEEFCVTKTYIADKGLTVELTKEDF